MATILEVIKKIAESNQSNDEDARLIQALLHNLGFPNAVVVCGIVYLEGQGTISAPPTSINETAKTLLKVIESKMQEAN